MSQCKRKRVLSHAVFPEASQYGELFLICSYEGKCRRRLKPPLFVSPAIRSPDIFPYFLACTRFLNLTPHVLSLNLCALIAGAPMDARRTAAPKLPASGPFNGMSTSPPTPPTFPIFAFPPSGVALHRHVATEQPAAISPASPLSPGGTSVGPAALAALATVSRPVPSAPSRAATAGKAATTTTSTASAAVDDTFEWLDAILPAGPLSQSTTPFPPPFPAPFPTPATPSTCGASATRVSWSAHSIHSAAAMPSARPEPQSSTAETLTLQQSRPLRSHQQQQQQRRLPRFQQFPQAHAGKSSTPVSTNTPYFTPVLQSGLTSDMHLASVAPPAPYAGATRDLSAGAGAPNTTEDNTSPDTPYYTPETAASHSNAFDMCGVMSDDDNDDDGDGWGWFVIG